MADSVIEPEWVQYLPEEERQFWEALLPEDKVIIARWLDRAERDSERLVENILMEGSEHG